MLTYAGCWVLGVGCWMPRAATGCWVPDAACCYWVLGAGCRVPGAGCQVPKKRHVPRARFRVPEARCQVPRAECRVPGARCRVHDCTYVLIHTHVAHEVPSIVEEMAFHRQHMYVRISIVVGAVASARVHGAGGCSAGAVADDGGG